MKKIASAILSVVALPLFVIFAQNAPESAQGTAETSIVEPSGADAPEVSVKEYQEQSGALTGRVVKLTFDTIVGYRQIDPKNGTATVCNSESKGDWINLTIPEAGLEFFDGLYTERNEDNQTVYVLVLSPFAAKALGTNYHPDNPAGARYDWE